MYSIVYIHVLYHIGENTISKEDELICQTNIWFTPQSWSNKLYSTNKKHLLVYIYNYAISSLCLRRKIHINRLRIALKSKTSYHDVLSSSWKRELKDLLGTRYCVCTRLTSLLLWQPCELNLLVMLNRQSKMNDFHGNWEELIRVELLNFTNTDHSQLPNQFSRYEI